MYNIVPVHSTRVPRVWNKTKNLIQSALDQGYGEMSLDKTYEDLCNRNKQLWLVVNDKTIDGACVTTIVNYDNYRSVIFSFLGGKNMKEWMGLLEETVIQWAKQVGAKSVEIVGRKGWTRKLKGWTTAYYHLRKEV